MYLCTHCVLAFHFPKMDSGVPCCPGCHGFPMSFSDERALDVIRMKFGKYIFGFLSVCNTCGLICSKHYRGYDQYSYRDFYYYLDFSYRDFYVCPFCNGELTSSSSLEDAVRYSQARLLLNSTTKKSGGYGIFLFMLFGISSIPAIAFLILFLFLAEDFLFMLFGVFTITALVVAILGYFLASTEDSKENWKVLNAFVIPPGVLTIMFAIGLGISGSFDKGASRRVEEWANWKECCLPEFVALWSKSLHETKVDGRIQLPYVLVRFDEKYGNYNIEHWRKWLKDTRSLVFLYKETSAETTGLVWSRSRLPVLKYYGVLHAIVVQFDAKRVTAKNSWRCSWARAPKDAFRIAEKQGWNRCEEQFRSWIKHLAVP